MFERVRPAMNMLNPLTAGVHRDQSDSYVLVSLERDLQGTEPS